MDKGLIFIGATLLTFAVLWKTLNTHIIKPSLLRKKLLQNGADGTATILSLKETGTYINDKPEVEYEVTIVGKDGETFNTTIRRVTSIVEIMQFQPKSEHQVKYDVKSREAMFLSAIMKEF